MIGAVLLLSALASMPARTIVVAPGTPMASLAAALARAADGDTILLRRGTYHESRLQVNRRVTILGEHGPVLDGDGEPILLISADGVSVRGLVLQHVATSYTDDRAAIRLSSVTGCRIEENVIRDAFFAIYAARSQDCVIAGNRIVGSGRSETGNANAIHLYATRGFIVERNDVRGHRDGIYIEFGRQALIRGNTSDGNARYGLHFMYSDSCAYRDNVFRNNRAGVAVMYSRNVVMTSNTFAGVTGMAAYGLLLKEIRTSRLTGNTFSGNTVALSVEGSDRLVATGNRFQRNGWAVRLYADAEEGHFEGNQFVNNAFDVVTNSRESSTTFAGNFWDRYDGYDLDRDGRGDVPFRPVRLFGLIVEQHPAAIILLNSLLVTLLDTAERVAPVLTPAFPVDAAPLMSWRS